MTTFRAIFRLLFMALYMMLRIGEIMFRNLVQGPDTGRSLRIRRSFTRGLFPAIGLRRHVRGTPPDFPCILMGNHRSYLDPALVAADVLGFPVSKAEVGSWPIIGYGVKVSGVLLLERESANSRKRTLKGIAEKVKEGWPVMLFPEGTTHAHERTTEFRNGGFRLAAQYGFPIVPMAIEYRHKEDYWLGNDSFLPHFFERFGQKHLDAWISYGPILRSDNAQEMLETCKKWIDAELERIHIEIRENP